MVSAAIDQFAYPFHRKSSPPSPFFSRPGTPFLNTHGSFSLFEAGSAALLVALAGSMS